MWGGNAVGYLAEDSLQDQSMISIRQEIRDNKFLLMFLIKLKMPSFVGDNCRKGWHPPKRQGTMR
jgi:hypothetical protein